LTSGDHFTAKIHKRKYLLSIISHKSISPISRHLIFSNKMLSIENKEYEINQFNTQKKKFWDKKQLNFSKSDNPQLKNQKMKFLCIQITTQFRNQEPLHKPICKNCFKSILLLDKSLGEGIYQQRPQICFKRTMLFCRDFKKKIL